MLHNLAKNTLSRLGLKAPAKRMLGVIGLQYYPPTPRDSRYPEPMTPEALASATRVSFPGADQSYSPPLFYPTEKSWCENNRAGCRHIKNALLTLYATLCELGCAVNHHPPEAADIVFDWAGKHVSYQPQSAPLIMEHGWLPRHAYQISPDGANARSHIAKEYRHQSLNPQQRLAVLNHITIMRDLFSMKINPRRVTQLQATFDEPFILFPLQLANDFNLRFSNSPFDTLYAPEPEASVAFAQACVDYLEAAELPLPILFKQHPSDPNSLETSLRIRNRRNRLIRNAEKVSTLDLFATGHCKLVVSVNSNTLHEGLIFDIPGIALGTLIWNESSGDRPLNKDLAAADALLQHGKALDDRRLSYLLHIFRHQWSLSDFQNPLIVRRLLETRGRCCPWELRRRYALDLNGSGQLDFTEKVA